VRAKLGQQAQKHVDVVRLAEVAGRDEHADTRLRERVFQLAEPVGGVDVDEDGAGFRSRVLGDHPFRGIRAPDTHAIAALDTEAQQAACRPIDRLQKPAVRVMRLLVAGDQRVTITEFRGARLRASPIVSPSSAVEADPCRYESIAGRILRDPVTLRHRFVAVGSHRLECAWIGPPPAEAPTLVFLHQGLGSIAQWRDFPQALCVRLGYGGLLYNRRGHGGSDPFTEPLSTRFLHDEATDVLPRVLDAFQVTRPILVGHSDGASIAIIHAASAAGSPRGLVVEAPHLFVEGITVSGVAELQRSYEGSLRVRLERYHGNRADALFQYWSDVWLRPEFRGWNIEDCLPAIGCPVLAIQGRDDEYGTLRQVTTIGERVPATAHVVILDDCGHSPHLDRRGDVEEAVAAFVRDVVR
jgi:pimeloyl-ACP methyl ester carboxylesterase